jgi:hypothetical protein
MLMKTWMPLAVTSFPRRQLLLLLLLLFAWLDVCSRKAVLILQFPG